MARATTRDAIVVGRGSVRRRRGTQSDERAVIERATVHRSPNTGEGPRNYDGPSLGEDQERHAPSRVRDSRGSHRRGDRVETLCSRRSRDFYLSAHEAVQYGLIDKVLIPQPKGMGGGGLGLGDGLSSFV